LTGVGTPSASVAPERAPRPRSGRRAERVATMVVIGAVAIGVIAGVALTPGFLTIDNVRAILRNASIVGIAAVGMTPITLSGNFISLGTQQSAMAASVVFIALVADGLPPALAIVVVVAGLLVVGAIQGAVVGAGLNPVITTLAAGAIIFGIVADATNGQVVSIGKHPVSWGDGTVAGIPVEVLVFALVTLVVGLFVSRTVAGREMTLCGANRETAIASGIAHRRVTLWAFMIFSAALGIAGVLTGAGFGQATIESLDTLTIDTVAAILVGGTAIGGGYGSPWRSAAGAILIAVISNVMILNNFSIGGRLAVEGAVVIVVVVLLEFLRRRREVR
jgi:ribose transport system permease protein